MNTKYMEAIDAAQDALAKGLALGTLTHEHVEAFGVLLRRALRMEGYDAVLASQLELKGAPPQTLVVQLGDGLSIVVEYWRGTPIYYYRRLVVESYYWIQSLLGSRYVGGNPVRGISHLLSDIPLIANALRTQLQCNGCYYSNGGNLGGIPQQQWCGLGLVKEGTCTQYEGVVCT